MVASGPLRVGVIGCGRWGPNHLRNFAALPEAVVVGAADPDPERRRAVSAQFRHVPVLADAEALLDLRPDAVVIATPVATHAPLALAAIARGIHVLCEKPLAGSAAAGEAVVAAAAARDVVLMVGHVFVWNAGIQRVKEMLDAGDLGQVRYLAARRTNLGPFRQDVNCAWDLAAHDVAIADFLLGATPQWVSAVGGAFLQPDIADAAFISLRYPGDVLASLLVSWLDPRKVRELTVVGDRAMVTWDDLAASGPVAVYDKRVVRRPYPEDFGHFQLLSREGDVRIPRVVLEEPLRAQARAFVRAVRTGDAGPASGRHGLAVTRTLEAIDESMRRHGRPVAVSAPLAPASVPQPALA